MALTKWRTTMEKGGKLEDEAKRETKTKVLLKGLSVESDKTKKLGKACVKVWGDRFGGNGLVKRVPH